ncbi:MAG: trypsin-like peptidase domain-containing protein [Christensenella sp.]|nr:trypsin-like peptidase domain-containing protein [Christensenella sp.]
MDENGFPPVNGNNSGQQDAEQGWQPQPIQQFEAQNNTEQAGQFDSQYHAGQQEQQYADPEGGQPEGKKPNKKKEKKHGIGGMMAVVAVAGILAGCLLMAFVISPLIQSRGTALPNLQESEQQAEASAAPDLGGEASAIQDTANPVVQIADEYDDSVVGVTAYNKQLVSGQEPVEQALAAGTGFFISNDGYILTNNHVIASGNLIKVKTSDNEEHVAEIVGADPATDIAVLKVDGLNDRAVPLANSDELKVGELAVAIGNVRGDTFSNTVTVGYVSVLSTPVMLNGIKMDMIQTDAAINPGNSGGPLVGSNGEVIGVTTAKKFISGYDESGNTLNSEGIGYAIPINKAVSIAQQLIENGSIPRAGIGISYSMISAVDANLWGTPRGALVVEVTEGGPAAKAGIQQNDVITSIDGVDLTDGTEIPSMAEKAIGDTISATVWREGKEYSVDMTLEDLNTFSSAS